MFKLIKELFPMILTILLFLCSLNFMLRLVEHEKSFYNLGPSPTEDDSGYLPHFPCP